MRKPKLDELVLIRWRDAHSSSGWTRLRDHQDEAICVTVGFVVRLSDNFVTLASSIWEGPNEENQVGDPISIPWGMILSIQKTTGLTKRRNNEG